MFYVFKNKKLFLNHTDQTNSLILILFEIQQILLYFECWWVLLLLDEFKEFYFLKIKFSFVFDNPHPTHKKKGKKKTNKKQKFKWQPMVANSWLKN